MVNNLLQFTSESATETQRIASLLARKIKGKTVICLYGNLGSGKTTFVQGFAKALGISNNIPSPTFVLVKEYPIKDGRVLCHVDLYRLENKSDVKTIGLPEILEETNMIVIIEWAEKAKTILPGKRINVFFEYINLNTRRIVIKRHS
jgi:tRNA threonylcarbamoyladenosine biosynthesis protein TsaE